MFLQGYLVEKVKGDFTTKYKSAPGEGIRLKMEETIDISLFNILALNYEPEGYAQWLPNCNDAAEVSVIALRLL